MTTNKAGEQPTITQADIDLAANILHGHSVPVYLFRAAARKIASYRIAAENRTTSLAAQDETLFDAIKHGDAEHQSWLKEAIQCHFSRKPIPPSRGGKSPSLAAAITEWEQSGEMPEWDSPLRDVFDAGVIYAHEKLAELVGAEDWQPAESDDYGGDVVRTMSNILAAAPSLAAQDGLASALEKFVEENPPLTNAALRSEVERLRAKVAAQDGLVEALESIDIWISDTLSGRVKPDTATYKDWLVEGLVEARNRARKAMAAIKGDKS